MPGVTSLEPRESTAHVYLDCFFSRRVGDVGGGGGGGGGGGERGACVCVCVCVCVCERERERERERETERDRERQRETERDRERQRQRQRQRETDRDRDRERETERDRERQRETERERQRDGQTETDTQRDTETDRDRQTDRQTETETDRDRQTERQRNNFYKVYIHFALFWFLCVNLIDHVKRGVPTPVGKESRYIKDCYHKAGKNTINPETQIWRNKTGKRVLLHHYSRISCTQRFYFSIMPCGKFSSLQFGRLTKP